VTRCYAWPLSVVDEAPLQLHVSTEHDRFAIRLFRCAATIEPADGPLVVFDGHDVPLGRPDEGWGWPRYTVQLAPALEDGIYVAVPVQAPADGDTEVIEATPSVLTRRDACLFVLRRNRPARGAILYKLPTATYGAYNQLGGFSLYAGAHWIRDWTGQGYVVSMQRPGNGGIGGRVMEGDAPDPYARSSRRQVFAHWDAPFVAWLESAGYQASYCTDFDLHEDDSLLEGCSLLLSAGHDEYWSPTMRQRVLEFVDRGGNVAFFGGDTACFEIDIAAAGDRLTCPKMAGGSPDRGELLIGALWHVNDPGDWLTLASGAWGGGWWDGRRAVEAYQPVVATHWAFDSVEFPPEGISGGTATPVIGYETDGVPLERGSGPPRMRAPGKGGGGGRVLLAVAKLSEGWVAGPDQPNAAMMIRTARSGGLVFSTGTTDWPLAIASDEGVRRITGNVVDHLAHPSLVLHGPTYLDGEYLGEGDAVGVGQVVSWYLDGAQSAALGLGPAQWTVDGGERVGDGPVLSVRAAGERAGWLTVTVSATDSAGIEHFGSRTVSVLDRETYLRRRIVAALHAMANPDEQGGNLVDQKASEAELASRVIPVRLRWVKRHAAVLDELMTELETMWERNGRMADASLRKDEM
jgi:hypothetical protein